MTSRVGVSLGHREPAEADHWIRLLTPAPVLACTHLVGTPYPHVAISLSADPGIATPAGLRSAAALAAASTTGRAVLFPGVANLTGMLPVAEVPAVSAIDRVEVLGGGAADPAALLDTGGFVRPQWRDGDLVLLTAPAAGGLLVPFERPDPTRCCAAH